MNPELTFYHAPQSRSLIVHWLLEELGLPYRLRVLNLAKEEHKSPQFLAVNPMGKVPALEHRGVIITEAAAICCYLADTFPGSRLGIPVGDPRRGRYLKWLFYGPTCLEPAVIDRLHRRPDLPPRALAYGSLELVVEVLARALRPGPHLLGERFTAADVVIGSGLRWGSAVKVLAERDEIVAYTSRLEARPAWQRVHEKDAELTRALA